MTMLERHQSSSTLSIFPWQTPGTESVIQAGRGRQGPLATREPVVRRARCSRKEGRGGRGVEVSPVGDGQAGSAHYRASSDM